MDYLKEYKSFINSYYLAEGLRITAGVALPAIILSSFGWQAIGLLMSLGAICVSASDSPGPIHQRRNGMIVTTAIVFIVALATGYIASFPLALGFLIVFFCFIFCMIGVYGSRVISIGVAALLVMVLNIDRPLSGWNLLMNAGFIAVGGAWYTMLSLLLYHVRPYKIVQQALGDCIMATADYLRTRARFYDASINYDEINRQMMEEQISVHQKQNLLRDLLFKSRSMIKESTTTGRTLMMIFMDTVDLFEKATSYFYPYETLHEFFDDTDILQRFKKIILAIADGLDDTGLAVKSGRASKEPTALQQQLSDLQEYFNAFSNAHRKPGTIEALITLRKILQAIEDMIARINTLHLYTRYDKRRAKTFKLSEGYEQFVTHTDMDWKLLLDNLSLKSNIFRHALRVSVAATTGYILSKALALGHSYWILLTIIVILKPAYSITQKRNYQRLLGTVTGAVIGLIILYIIKDKTALFVIMLLLMIGTYSFLRTNYLVSVICMTPYILLFFHLLDSTHFKTIVLDRLVDTGIGSAIAFAASFLLVPAWEHTQIRNYMVPAIGNSLAYYKNVSTAFIRKPVSELQFKLSRKEAFVSLANLSEVFQRMLAEPKSKQKDSKSVHQFVVLNQTLISHIASLAHFAKTLAEKYRSHEFNSIIQQTEKNLSSAKEIIEKGSSVMQVVEENKMVFALDQQVKELIEKRKAELEQGILDSATRRSLSELKPIVDQFKFIASIAVDIRKVCEGMQSI